MNPLALAIPEDNAEAWLAVVADLRVLRDVAMPASLVLDGGLAAVAGLRRRGVVVACVHDLLPEALGRYLETLAPPALDAAVDTVVRRLRACHTLGLHTAGLPLGMDRLEAAPDAATESRSAFLRRVIPMAGDCTVDLCLPVRCPLPFPHSRQWNVAANLLHDIMHPSLRLALDVLPFELPADFDPAAFVRRFCFQAGIVRFHHDAEAGEMPSREMLLPWWLALRRHNFRGVVVLKPRVVSAERIEPVCRRLDQLAGEIAPPAPPAAP